MINMNSVQVQKPHIVCLPAPAQGHINPFMQLAKILHRKGFHITFVHAEFIHRRLLQSEGPEFVKSSPDFRFETISDGLPQSDENIFQDITAIINAMRYNFVAPFKELVVKLNSSSPEIPRVRCIISDNTMSFAMKIAEEFGIPQVHFCTYSACGFIGCLQFDELVRRGIFPFKDENFMTNGTMDTLIDWIPGMTNVRLRDIPSFIRSNSVNDTAFDFLRWETQNNLKSSAIMFNTFQDFEHQALEAFRAKFPNIYNIGPLSLLERHLQTQENHRKMSHSSSLWREDNACLAWLDKWEPNSVVYVNYGSTTTMSEQHMKEFAWGLANSKHPFMWVTRPNVVMGEAAVLPQEFLDEVKDRGYLTSWCPQKQVLGHPSVGVFLTHCGWNSTVEGVCEGVPLICWPFFAEQPTNCRYACTSWGIGMELGEDVKRDEVEAVIAEMMVGDKGKEMKQKALEWKRKATEATEVGGSSYNDFHSFINDFLH